MTDDTLDDNYCTTECVQTPFATRWKDKLQQCEINYRKIIKDSCERTSTNITDNSNDNHNMRWQQQYTIETDYYMELYRFEQELYKIRQQFLSTSDDYIIIDHNSNKNQQLHQSIMNGDVHTLPLHDEYMKCQDMLEKIRVGSSCSSSNSGANSKSRPYHLQPHGSKTTVPFLFYKYRLQQQQSIKTPPPPHEIIPAEPVIQQTTNSSIITTPSSSSVINTKVIFDPILSLSSLTVENLSHRIIIIDQDGNVQHQPRHIDDHSDKMMIRQSQYLKRSSDDLLSIQKSYGCSLLEQRSVRQSIVIRNVHYCDIEILGEYKSIYLTNIENTTVDVCNPVGGAVHVTDCQHVSFIHGLQAQQLRLHNSHHINCYHTMISAGTILEDCTNLIFYILSSVNISHVRNSIKDFDWLHNNIASPNYSIQICDESTITHIDPSDTDVNHLFTDHATVEVLNVPTHDEDSDDDEI